MLSELNMTSFVLPNFLFRASYLFLIELNVVYILIVVFIAVGCPTLSDWREFLPWEKFENWQKCQAHFENYGNMTYSNAKFIIFLALVPTIIIQVR